MLFKSSPVKKKKANYIWGKWSRKTLLILSNSEDAAATHAKLIRGKHSGPKEENQRRPFLRGLNN